MPSTSIGRSALSGDPRVGVRVIEFAREQHLPSASTYTTYARNGGLLSLGTDMGSIFRSAAEYMHRIIHGARPSELPVQRPTKFALVISHCGPMIPMGLRSSALLAVQSQEPIKVTTPSWRGRSAADHRSKLAPHVC